MIKKQRTLILLLIVCMMIVPPICAEMNISTNDYLIIPTYDVYLNSFKNYLPAEHHDIHKTLYDFGGLENGGFLYGVSYEKGLLGSDFRYSIYGDKGNSYIKEIEIKVSEKEYSENKYTFISCLRSSIMAMLPEYYDNPAILDTILKNIAFDEITNTSFNTAKQSYIYGAYEYSFEKNNGYKFTMLSVFN
ncbi:MAG: hypothetical protein ACOX54_01070 [Christensenellales bacterium]|jgi:hypothetical protein|nr:hypothetical protein [Christensenellaceae bacterium]